MGNVYVGIIYFGVLNRGLIGVVDGMSCEGISMEEGINELRGRIFEQTSGREMHRASR